MGVDEPVDVAKVLRPDQLHVAIRAVLRLGRIVKRARPLAGDAAGLPVVIIVETPQPAVVVDGNVQMHLVAGGAESRNLISLLMKRLQKRVAMRLGIEFHIIVMQPSEQRALTLGEFRE